MEAIIIGAGTYGQVYLHYLQQAGWKIKGFLDDDRDTHGKPILGTNVIGGIELLSEHIELGITNVFCPIGNNLVRTRINAFARSLGLVTPNFIHHSAIVDSNISPDSGVYLFPGTVIMPHSHFGTDVMVSSGGKVAHHTTLENGVFLSTNASVGANIRVGQRVYFGMNTTAVTGKCREIGSDAVVGAGAVVLTDVPQKAVFAGTPAKAIYRT